MSLIKILFINLALTFSFLGMLLLTPPIVVSLFSLFEKAESLPDLRSELSLYKNFPWAEQHFIEFVNLTTSYHDFITWRRDDFSGVTINIQNGVRNTIGSTLQHSDNEKYYFFGGSTTWGMGVDDGNTYPSLFAQTTHKKVINFGETAYIARQSLAYLNNKIIREPMFDLSRAHVLFYDGVNDVLHRCRAENEGLGTVREKQIRDQLSSLTRSPPKYSFAATFNQLQEFLVAVARKLKVFDRQNAIDNGYDCASNPEKTEKIARTLVDTWQAASNLVERHG